MACSWSRIKKTTKKELYVYVSIFLAVFLTGTIINDLVAYTILEKTSKSTQSITDTLLLIHILSFVVAILGFVYNSQAGKNYTNAYLEWTAIVFNFLVCFIRVAVEIAFIQFREEVYKNFTESGK
ncbi:uncharacterized protein [Amphiura filiformis]|uniref:uncharacterized protein n=1 Tax=Amphiura filiformis TaxID=82378 RepID=UPI003B21281A